MNSEEIEKLKKAGEIAQMIIPYAKGFIKKDMLLLEIAEKIEKKIEELGGKPAFPVNTSINHVAAHYTPSIDDKSTAKGLLKIDFGVHIDGYISDNAFSLNLEHNENNNRLIHAAEEALKNVLNEINSKMSFSQAGEIIQKSIMKHGFAPIRNLSGHGIAPYIIHAGKTVPNYDNKNDNVLGEGYYAIEPFATNGNGSVHEGGESGIYALIKKKPVRDELARKIIQFIEHNYKTLPFCSRWIVKEFSSRALFSLRILEQNGIIKHYPQLVEDGGGIVSQAERTLYISKDEVILC
ncbi:type II methionyl aminopeptidase [Candidatus Pacearchaeota archaeon]|nr:type II methionyl aminopeptidase [Candidatus Pacearchaeota archaeon]